MIINARQAETMLNSYLNENALKCYTFEHNISFDCDLSRIYFNDFKSEIENQSLWLDSYLVIFENEALKNSPYYKKSHLAKMNKLALYDLCEQYEILNFYHSEYNFEDNTKQALIDELMTYCTNEKYYMHHFSENSWHNLDNSFVIRGNCQGEACAVKLVGKCEAYLNSTYLENIFYNTPLSGYINIYLNGQLMHDLPLYDIHNFDDYKYYDKSDLIELIKQDASLITEDYYLSLLDYLTNNLKKTFDYSY